MLSGSGDDFCSAKSLSALLQQHILYVVSRSTTSYYSSSLCNSSRSVCFGVVDEMTDHGMG